MGIKINRGYASKRALSKMRRCPLILPPGTLLYRNQCMGTSYRSHSDGRGDVMVECCIYASTIHDLV